MTESRIETTRKPIKCLSCGGSPVATIMYGLPVFSNELEQELESGKTVLGGCCISDDDPVWKCTQCGQDIYRKQK